MQIVSVNTSAQIQSILPSTKPSLDGKISVSIKTLIHRKLSSAFKCIAIEEAKFYKLEFQNKPLNKLVFLHDVVALGQMTHSVGVDAWFKIDPVCY